MEAIKRYLREHYTDERLKELLTSARNGTLSFLSCCCLVGMATAPDGHVPGGLPSRTQYAHYRDAVNLPGGRDAEIDYAYIADNDVGRRAAIIPVILEEMERRQRERT